VALTGKQIQGIIRTHKSKSKQERRDWDRWRSWYVSEYWGAQPDQPSGSSPIADDPTADINFETNYPYAFIDTMIANICPQNPQMTVLARQEKMRPAAQFREALINDVFRRNKLHSKLWKTAINTSICGRAFTKTVWNFRKGSAEIFEVDPRYVFFDMSAAKWEDIRYLVEVTVLTETEYKTRRAKKQGRGTMYNEKVAEKATFTGFPTWLKDNANNSTMLNEASHSVYKWVTVYEVYDFQGKGRYYHFLEDVEEPLFSGELPYRYSKNPFALLAFNENMANLAGLSDIKLIQSLQERLNEIDTLELWHAHTSTPVMLVNTALVDNPEDIMTALADANQPGSMVAVQGKANAPLGDIIGQTPMPAITPSFADMRARCNQVIEFILGIPQYSRGVVGVADVATEVALADTATRTRNGRRIKQVEDMLRDMADKIVSLYEEFLPEDSQLPIRLTDSQKVLRANRETLQFRNDRDPEERALEYDYEAIPYSPTENHRLVQLQKLQQYMPLLLQSQIVDQEKLLTKLLDLLQMREVLVTQQGPDAPPAMPPQQPGMPGTPPGMPQMPGMGGPLPPNANLDTLNSGALPEGTEPPPVPTPMGGPGNPFM
jgi:hypothetical protein